MEIKFLDFGRTTLKQNREYKARKERASNFFKGIREGNMAMIIPSYRDENYNKP